MVEQARRMGEYVEVTICDETGQAKIQIPTENHKFKLGKSTFLFELTPMLFESERKKNLGYLSSRRSLKPEIEQKLVCKFYCDINNLDSDSFGIQGYWAKCVKMMRWLGIYEVESPNYKFFEQEIYRQIKSLIRDTEEPEDSSLTHSVLQTHTKNIDNQKRPFALHEPKLSKIKRQKDYYTEKDLYSMFKKIVSIIKKNFREFKFEPKKFKLQRIIQQLLDNDIIVRVTREGQSTLYF